jgi:hypothetical protein
LTHAALINDNSFKDDPEGWRSPRSHWLINPGFTLSTRANTPWLTPAFLRSA